MTNIDDAVAYTEGNYEAAMETLIEGSVLAVIVVFLFLRNMRATLIAADRAAARRHPDVLDHVHVRLLAQPREPARHHAGDRHSRRRRDRRDREHRAPQNMGKSPYRAALEAADEIGLAVIAISLTIVAIFAPVSFMGGIAGQYFKQFGLTVAAAVLISLLVARLITPMMAAYLMRPVEREAAGRRRCSCAPIRAFSRRRCALRYLTLIVGVGAVLGSHLGDATAAVGLHPGRRPLARRRLGRACRRARRSKIPRETTDKMVTNAQGIPEVKTRVRPRRHQPDRPARGAPGDAHRPARAARPSATLTQKQVEELKFEQAGGYPRYTHLVRQRARRARTVVQHAVGNDGDALREPSAKLESALRAKPELRERGCRSRARTAGNHRRPELRRSRQARRLGRSRYLRRSASRTIGDVDFNLAKFNAGDRQVPIRVQIKEVGAEPTWAASSSCASPTASASRSR